MRGGVDYKLYQKDADTQNRNSKSVQALVVQWMKANPNATRRNPACSNALSRYLCGSAMPPCDEHNSWCSGVFYPCKSMCNETLKACYPSGDASLEKGGFGWFSCKSLPMTDEVANKDDGHSASANADNNGTGLVPVPSECWYVRTRRQAISKLCISLFSHTPSLISIRILHCSVTSKWNKDKLLPDARTEMCAGGGATRQLQANGSYVYARRPAKVGIKEACSVGSVTPMVKWLMATAVVAVTVLQFMAV